MRVCITILIAIISFSLAWTQGIIVLDQFDNAQIQDIEYLDDSTFVTAISIADANASTAILWYRNSELFHEQLIGGPASKLDIRRDGDSLFLDYTYNSECDLTLNGFITFPLDSTESTFYNIPETSLSNEGISESAYINPELKLLLDNEGVLFYLDSNNIVFRTDTIASQTPLYLRQAESKIAVLGADSTVIRNVLDSEEEDVLLMHENDQGYEILLFQNKYHVLTFSNIYVFTKDGAPLEVIDLPEDFYAHDFIIADDSLMLLASPDFSEMVYIHKLAENRSWKEYYRNEHQSFRLSKLRTNARGEIILLGSLGLIGDLSHLFIYETGVIINTSEEVSYSQDIGLSDFVYDVNFNQEGPDTLDVSITVHNNANVDAYNVHIHSTAYNYYFCSGSSIDSLIPVVAAKSSMEIKFTGLRYPNEIATVYFCFYIGGANQHFDRAQDDNQACEIIVSVQDIERKPNSLRVYPNPSNSWIFTDSAETGDQITIHDIHGNLLKKHSYEQGINISGLLPGIFFLRNERTREIGRFVRI